MPQFFWYNLPIAPQRFLHQGLYLELYFSNLPKSFLNIWIIHAELTSRTYCIVLQLKSGNFAKDLYIKSYTRFYNFEIYPVAHSRIWLTFLFFFFHGQLRTKRRLVCAKHYPTWLTGICNYSHCHNLHCITSFPALHCNKKMIIESNWSS